MTWWSRTSSRLPDDGPETDGCELDFVEHADDPQTQALRPLFPDGVADESKAAAYRELAGG